MATSSSHPPDSESPLAFGASSKFCRRPSSCALQTSRTSPWYLGARNTITSMLQRRASYTAREAGDKSTLGRDNVFDGPTTAKHQGQILCEVRNIRCTLKLNFWNDSLRVMGSWIRHSYTCSFFNVHSENAPLTMRTQDDHLCEGGLGLHDVFTKTARRHAASRISNAVA